MFALVVSDGRPDFAQNLPADVAHRRAQRRRRVRRVEIEDAHKVFMFEGFIRIQSAAAHQGIADADPRGAPKRSSDTEYIILRQERIRKDVENFALVVLPVFPRKTRSQLIKLHVQRIVCIRPIIGFQHLRNRRNVLTAQFPEIQVSRMLARTGVRNVKHISQFRSIPACVNERNALRTAADVPTHGIVPDVVLRASRGIRPLRENHHLFAIRVLVKPRSGGQKRLPPLQTAGQLPLRLLGHLPVFLQFACHRFNSLEYKRAPILSNRCSLLCRSYFSSNQTSFARLNTAQAFGQPA